MHNNFKNNLLNILNDINSFESRNTVIENCVETKLNDSYEMYSKDIEKICNYLLSRSNKKVIRNIGIEQRKEINNIEQRS